MGKVLVITDNPEPDSLTHAATAAFADGAWQNGLSVEVLDLHKRKFNPVYSLADRAYYLGQGPVPDDVAEIQCMMLGVDIIAFVFPIYWYSMPAMMKGVFDRVLCRGFAYHDDGSRGAIADRIVRVIALTGASKEDNDSMGISQMLRTRICDEIFTKYCGVKNVALHVIDNLAMGDNSPEKRREAAAKLVEIHEMSKALVEPAAAG